MQPVLVDQDVEETILGWQISTFLNAITLDNVVRLSFYLNLHLRSYTWLCVCQMCEYEAFGWGACFLMLLFQNQNLYPFIYLFFLGVREFCLWNWKFSYRMHNILWWGVVDKLCLEGVGGVRTLLGCRYLVIFCKLMKSCGRVCEKRLAASFVWTD